MNSSSSLDVDDLIQGLGEWRNIQDIVRVTFRALNDVVKAQGARIAELEQALVDRPTRDELQASLARKADVDDVNSTLAGVSEALDATASAADLASQARVLEERIGTAEAEAEACRQHVGRVDADLERVRAELRTKGGATDVARCATKVELASLPTSAEFARIKVDSFIYVGR